MDFGFRQGILTNGSAAYKDNIKYDRRRNYQSLPFALGQERRERQGILQGSQAFAGALPNGGAGTAGALAKVADRKR